MFFSRQTVKLESFTMIAEFDYWTLQHMDRLFLLINSKTSGLSICGIRSFGTLNTISLRVTLHFWINIFIWLVYYCLLSKKSNSINKVKNIMNYLQTNKNFRYYFSFQDRKKIDKYCSICHYNKFFSHYTKNNAVLFIVK